MENKTGKNLRFLRENNTREVLRYLTIHGDSSRIKLSKELGLSKMTITNIVNELQKYGYLCESDICLRENIGSTGPKPILLSVKQNKILSIGVYILAEKIICTLSDVKAGELFVHQEKVDIQCKQETLNHVVCTMIQKVLEFDKEFNSSIVGIGIVSTTSIEAEKGILLRNKLFLNHYLDVLKEVVKKQFDYPVYIANDMQASIIGEEIYGYGKKYSKYMYLGITTSIGMSVISNGKLIVGESNVAVEAGHMSVNIDGELCQCGNRGCLNLYASLPVLLKESGCQSMEELLELYEKKDLKCVAVVNKFIHIISVALINWAKIFDLELVILGHEGAMLPQEIIELISTNVNNVLHVHSEKRIEVVIATFSTLSALRGATSIVFSKFFTGEIEWIQAKKIEEMV
ncbi:ROK family transcriptional regulator [Anaeromicropila populeti]|uniref:Sugar kinase of the NBD/HSP70 family, may contain an N-terminal HTH domain n=1 Tax=Anaeromicropila populeti TaxID=37658 RepID=A0A1I6IAM3_9FIRM|nr:ROK family transcriptional regulator [Anaeromicropila populeti]SFR63731.1 Sugar kinase of the NBD/HSP70 family, may contain an N-terminal HTH domain [Anaeromicropila populeti]